ncbi:MAG TPA: hypothetical protein DCW53_03050 [Rikenellaceae bacterium]|nr:hypothetical protein [Rikenellaceae bacterium]
MTAGLFLTPYVFTMEKLSMTDGISHTILETLKYRATLKTGSAIITEKMTLPTIHAVASAHSQCLSPRK